MRRGMILVRRVGWLIGVIVHMKSLSGVSAIRCAYFRPITQVGTEVITEDLGDHQVGASAVAVASPPV